MAVKNYTTFSDVQAPPLVRCTWPGADPLMIVYHDTEWGVPCHDDQKLFEYIVLDTFQAGLSWQIILRKRENFRRMFDNFNAVKITRYTDAKLVKLMADTGIIRNRLKIASAIRNAKCYL